MTQGWTGITAVNQLIYLCSDLLKNLVRGTGVDKQVKTTHLVPYRPNMGILLGTDVGGVENEHTVRGGAEWKGNDKI
jgi:hypothetical protein